MQTQTAMSAILTAAQMRDAERRAMQRGLSGWAMMERAGEAATGLIRSYYDPRPVRVLCGPGNNGGDGFVIATALRRAGWPVEVACLFPREALKGDAATAASRWEGDIAPLSAIDLPDRALVVDALFGTGLDRTLEGEAADMLGQVAERGLRVVAIDILSGVQADSGALLSEHLPAAEMTITFAAKKPGHLLLPGVEKSGVVLVADIGIAQEVAAVTEGEPLMENLPEHWRARFPWPSPGSHKYTRGSVVVLGGSADRTGASRLAAGAALRAGAGAVTLSCEREALSVNAAHLTAVMIRLANTVEEFGAIIRDKKHNTILLGPGAGVTERTVACVMTALETGKNIVLDADALTAFSGNGQTLFSAVRSPAVMTPHDGELERLFKDTDFDIKQPKWARARDAARCTGIVAVLKGYDTVIAAPDGRAAINSNSVAELATAGSGDVLAGIIAALMAQGMPAFEAACAGVWLHAQAGASFGPGLIAEDLAGLLPGVLAALKDG